MSQFQLFKIDCTFVRSTQHYQISILLCASSVKCSANTYRPVEGSLRGSEGYGLYRQRISLIGESGRISLLMAFWKGSSARAMPMGRLLLRRVATGSGGLREENTTSSMANNIPINQAISLTRTRGDRRSRLSLRRSRGLQDLCEV